MVHRADGTLAPASGIVRPSRRDFLLGAGAGLGVALFGGRVFATEVFAGRKLVVIICRGGLDGLSLAPPIGDANYAALRGPIAIPAEQALRIDGDFAFHPKLASLQKLTLANQARFAPAVGLPAIIRSHFEAQDLLETGGPAIHALGTGWINRALQAVDSSGARKAIALGEEMPLILRGPAPVASWSPGGAPVERNGEAVTLLQDLYAGDPLLGPALSTGLATDAMADMAAAGQVVRRRDLLARGKVAGRMLADATGPSIAVMSLGGYDTHSKQGGVEGQLAERIGDLDTLVDALRGGLGQTWNKTVVIAVTEFGRTARVNGTGGTDHGDASTMLVAGGAIKAGGIIGDWPTLAPGRLNENRDLASTIDVRTIFKGVLRDHMGFEPRTLDDKVFPGSAALGSLKDLVRA